MSWDPGMPLRIFFYAVALGLSLLLLGKVRSRTARQAGLLVVSYALYLTWGSWFLGVLLASTIINFLVGRWIARQPSMGKLWAALGFNLLLLAAFKYVPGVAVAIPFASLQRFAHLALPLGISFWSFQAMSYLFDVYRGKDLDPTLWEFALYMAFFPIVISGPICRMPDMLPQFRSDEAPSRNEVGGGLCRIATGVLMMQIAQLLGKGIFAGQGINAGFDQAASLSGLDVWCLIAGYGLQIFFDFAGYSHIAIGAARMMGFTVPENFNRPFASTTPSVFWTRWHMSLSFWIRDYVFMPVALTFRQEWWRKFCLLLSMVLFGIWHGATILFVLFGCYHGVLLILHRQVQQVERRMRWAPTGKLWTAFSWLLTMVLITLGWIFFRSGSLAQAGQMFSALASPAGYTRHTLDLSLYLLVGSLAVLYALVLATVDALDRQAERLGTATATPAAEILAIAVRDRWIWVLPLWGAACVLVMTMIPHQSRAANVFMYRFF